MPGFKRLFRRLDVDRDVDEELQFHVDMKARDLADERLSTADARIEALSRFGDFKGIRGQCLTIQSSVARRRSRRNFLDSSGQDLRFAVRALGRSPGFTTMAVLTLALGIGGNTAIFSVMNSVVLRPFPYPAPDRLVQMVESNPERAAEQGWPSANARVSLQNYRDYRELNTVFEEIGWVGWAGNPSGVNLAGGNRPERVRAVSTSASLLPTLGIEPLLGRGWLPAEEEFSFEGPRVAILSHGLWMSQFGADPTVLGRSITVDEWPHTIVGVMPPHFDIPPVEFQGALSSVLSGADLYVPLGHDAFGFGRAARQVTVIARLREGVEIERAREEMNTLAVGLADAYPGANRGWSVRLIPLRDLLARSVGPQIALLMAAAGLVLLIGCTNVANLLLARGVARSSEIAVRAALGGGRTRIVRQLLTESLVLASAAGGIGLLLAYAGNQVLVSLIPAGMPRVGDTRVDGTVLAFATLVTLGTGVVFGLVPALRASRTDLATTMRAGTGRGTGSRTGAGMSRILVTSEVALAVMLLAAAGLLTRNFARLAGAQPGYEPENLLKVALDVGRPNTYNTKYFTCDPNSDAVAPRARCPRNTDELERFYDRVVERVERVPGVRSAALIDIAPLQESGAYPLRIPASSDPAAPSGDTPGNDAGGREAEVLLGNTGGNIVRPGYFQTMGMRILAGRDFRGDDPSWWSGVAVVNERLARRVWPGENPLGKRIAFYRNDDWMTVIGVVEDAQHDNLSERVKFDYEGRESQVYYLGYFGNMDLVVRTDADPNTFVEPIREALLELDPGMPAGAAASFDELAAESNATPRFYALMVGIFAGFALLLTAVGLYGLMAYTVGRRTKEIGLRMALGAHKRDITKMALGHAAKSVGLGVVLGVAGSLALSGVLRSFLYGMDPVDPLTYGAVALVLAGVAVVAGYVPASRASRSNPTEALRYE